jgi:hypothetical protein
VVPGRAGPYLAAIGAAAVLPLLALIMVAISGGLVRFTRSTAEAHAAATLTPVFCAAVLVWRVWWDVYLIDLSVAVKVGGVIGLILLALAVIVDRSLIRFLAIAAVVAVAYGISVVTLADVQLDRSPGENFQSQVVDSHVSRGKNSRTLLRQARAVGTPAKRKRGLGARGDVQPADDARACRVYHPVRWRVRHPMVLLGRLSAGRIACRRRLCEI